MLEYLGVPHDQPLKTKKEMMVAQKETSADGPSETTADLNEMFDDVNSLPADDPLRAQANIVAQGSEKPAVAESKAPGASQGAMSLLPAKTVAAFQASSSDVPAAPVAVAKVDPPVVKSKGAVVVNAGLRVPVPSFEGAALRSVVERAGAIGLRVQAVGSGLAREQVPAAGTMVPTGTEVVVRFAR